MVQPGAGPKVFQYPAPNLAPLALSQASGTGTPVGCAEQYGRLRGLAKLSWSRRVGGQSARSRDASLETGRERVRRTHYCWW